MKKPQHEDKPLTEAEHMKKISEVMKKYEDEYH